MSNGPVLQQTTDEGIPGSIVALDAGSTGGGPGSSAQPVPPSASVCFTVAGASVCLVVSDNQDGPLPVALKLATIQYQRLYDAVQASS
jgi:hypothetical protein